MRTGFDNIVEPKQNIPDDLTHKVESMLKLLIEKSITSALYYMSSTTRKTLTSSDVQYGMMYECHEFFNNEDLENEFEKVYNEEDSEEDGEEEEDVKIVDDEFEPFEISDSKDPIVVKMNRYAEEWDMWAPTEPLQRTLKDAIDKMK